MMSIRAVGTNSLNPEDQKYKYKPDISFDKDKELINFLKTKPLVKFNCASSFGFSSVEKYGYLVPEKVQFQGKDYKNNAIFVLDSKGTKLKETHSLKFVELIADPVRSNSMDSVSNSIHKIRDNNKNPQSKKFNFFSSDS